MSTFTTNPLWKVVDGPWKLSSFSSDGDYSYVPNKNYSGPDKPILAQVNNVPYTSDTAELDALRSGSSLDVGTLPLNDIASRPRAQVRGLHRRQPAAPRRGRHHPEPLQRQVGPLLRQLYIRQALEDLINRPQIVSKIYDGYADPGNGPVPVKAFRPWTSPLEKSGGPYPYAPSKAATPADGARLEGDAERHLHLPASGHRRGRLRGRHRGGPAAVASSSSTPPGRHHGDEQEAAIQSSEAQAGVADQPQVRAVQHADLHRRALHREQPPGLDLRLAAGRLRLRPVRPVPGRRPGSSTPAATTTRAATPAPKRTR